jgi:hypothetical protein
MQSGNGTNNCYFLAHLFIFKVQCLLVSKCYQEIDWPSFLKLFYIFGHETHLFDNHLYMYLKYTVFRGIIPVFIN